MAIAAKIISGNDVITGLAVVQSRNGRLVSYETANSEHASDPNAAFGVANLDARFGTTDDEASTMLATAQATATTTSSVLVPSRKNRRSVTVTNHGATVVYLGTGTVTSANGTMLPGTAGATRTFRTSAAINGIAASGTQVVSYAEEFD